MKKNVKIIIMREISFQTSMNPLRVDEMSFTGFYEMNIYICNLIFLQKFKCLSKAVSSNVGLWLNAFIF
jgi:hypothetical protein